MNLPRFTADASLYKTSQVYMTGAQHFRAGLSNVVQPAMAIYIDGRFVCNGEVTPNGFINCYPGGGGGGPREPTCRPRCSTCRNVPGEGRIRVCIRRDCESVEVPC